MSWPWSGWGRTWFGLSFPGVTPAWHSRERPRAFVSSRVSPPWRFSFLSSSLSLTAPAGLPLSASLCFRWDGLMRLSDGENQELQPEQVLCSLEEMDRPRCLYSWAPDVTHRSRWGNGLTVLDGAAWQESSSATCRPLPRTIWDLVFALGRRTHPWRNHGEGAASPPTRWCHSCPLFSVSC